MEDARTRLAAHDYVKASGMVNIARAQSNQSHEYLSPREYDEMQKQAGDLATSIEADQVDLGPRVAKLKNSQVRASAGDKDAADKNPAVRINQIADHRSRFCSATDQNAQALVAAEQALAQDPTNMAAQMYLTDILRDESNLRISDALLKQKANYVAEVGLQAREAVIPYTDLLTYPTDWPQLSEASAKRLQSGINVESDADRNTRHLLDEKIIENSAFNGDSLETALNFVRDATGANMVILWGAIEAAGIKRDKTVTQPLKHVSAAQLLKVILDGVSTEQSSPEDRLAYSTEGGIVKIATRQ